MDAFPVLRMLGALCLVLGLLGGALWMVRRFNLRLPGQIGGGHLKRIEVIERAALDSRRSIALLRRDGREHLILLSPEGNVIVEAGIVRDEVDLAASAQREAEANLRREAAEAVRAAARADIEAMRHSFARLVDTHSAGLRRRVAERVMDTGEGVTRLRRRADDAIRAAGKRMKPVLADVLGRGADIYQSPAVQEEPATQSGRITSQRAVTSTASKNSSTRCSRKGQKRRPAVTKNRRHG